MKYLLQTHIVEADLTWKVPWIIFVDINLFDEFNFERLLFHLSLQIKPNKFFICRVESKARKHNFFTLFGIIRVLYFSIHFFSLQLIQFVSFQPQAKEFFIKLMERSWGCRILLFPTYLYTLLRYYLVLCWCWMFWEVESSQKFRLWDHYESVKKKKEVPMLTSLWTTLQDMLIFLGWGWCMCMWWGGPHYTCIPSW